MMGTIDLTGDEAVELALKFLQLMEAREIDQAEALMNSGAQIIFPGGVTFNNQREMVEASRGRYKWVKKGITHTEAFKSGVGFVIYIRGFLYGENNFGKSFDHVRFIDRFEIDNGLIVRQEVWNDLAEQGVLKEDWA